MGESNSQFPQRSWLSFIPPLSIKARINTQEITRQRHQCKEKKNKKACLGTSKHKIKKDLSPSIHPLCSQHVLKFSCVFKEVISIYFNSADCIDFIHNSLCVTFVFSVFFIFVFHNKLHFLHLKLWLHWFLERNFSLKDCMATYFRTGTRFLKFRKSVLW